MTIQYLGSTVTYAADVAPQGPVLGAVSTIAVPPGVTDGATLIVVGEVGYSVFTGNAFCPSDWHYCAGATYSVMFEKVWHTGDPMTAQFGATGYSSGYWGWMCVAYSNCTLDHFTVAVNSLAVPAVQVSGPQDILVSIYAPYAQAAESGEAPTLVCSGLTTRQSYSQREYGYTGIDEIAYFAIAVADSNGTIAQGTTSDSAYTWSPAATSVLGGTYVLSLAGAATPQLPTLYAPASGSFVDFTAGQQFSAVYNNTDGSVCQRYQFRIKVSGASSYTYWNAGSAAFQSTPAWNDGSAAFTLPGSILSNANTYNWSFATQSSYSTSLVSGFASDRTVIGQPPPTVVVLGPTGTVPTAAPTVTWSATAGGTASLTSWRVATYLTSATTQTGFAAGQASGLLDDSGIMSGTGTSYVTGYLPNLVDLTSYVQVTQSGSQSSAWVATAFFTSYGVPQPPTMSTGGPTYDSNGAPVVALQVVCPANPALSGALSAIVYFTDANNPAPTPVRVTVPVTAGGGTVVIPDYELTFGVPRTYTAAVVGTTNGPSASSAPITVTQMAPGAGGSRNWVISDPLNPSLFLIPYRLGGQSSGTTSLQSPTSIEIDRSRNQTVFRPFGKSTATLQYGDVYAPTFTINLLLLGYAQVAMLDALWSSTDTLLVRSDMGDAWYVDAGATRPVVILSAGDRNLNPLYVCTLACTVTDRP